MFVVYVLDCLMDLAASSNLAMRLHKVEAVVASSLGHNRVKNLLQKSCVPVHVPPQESM